MPVDICVFVEHHKGYREVFVRHNHGILEAQIIDPTLTRMPNGDLDSAFSECYDLFCNQTVYFIREIRVDEKHRGRGIGSRMLEAALMIAEPFDLTLLMAYPLCDTITHHSQWGPRIRQLWKWYRSLGFKKLRRNSSYMVKLDRGIQCHRQAKKSVKLSQRSSPSSLLSSRRKSPKATCE